MEFKDYKQTDYDCRVKKLLEIENIYYLLVKITKGLIISFILVLLLANFVKAASIPDLFLVPVVTITPSGAAVFQPQTGAGLEAVTNQKQTPPLQLNNVLSAPSTLDQELDIYGKSSNYRPPVYDPFAEGSMNQPIKLPEDLIKKIESVSFNIVNNIPGSNDSSLGTTKTTFTFTPYISSNSISSLGLEYRWDFENDGQLDSYFSTVKSISHTYTIAGQYEVKLEVLDKTGNVYQAIRKVTVVENDAPSAYFQVDKISAPINTIIKFDTSLSSDNQYNRDTLKYRFDWDGDNQFDTNFQYKTQWFHQFAEVGNYNVKMEVMDREGASAQAIITIDILDDSQPEARLSISRRGEFNYQFDASASYDDHTPLNLLKFRWDFNYDGVNDIVFDTVWSNSPKINGTYKIGGNKKIRLQVMDAQGFIGESYAEIDVPWIENYLNLAAGLVNR